jgi:hypothetical protein
MSDRGLYDVDFGAMRSRGVVVVPRFLDEAELESLRADYLAKSVAINRNLTIKDVSAACIQRVSGRLRDVAERVRAAAGIDADHLTGGNYFAIDLGVNEPWHQDHESYFLFQQHYHYLNFWIPIVKPERARSNLSFVTHDALAARAPAISERMVGGGATRAVQVRGGTTLLFDDGGGRAHLDFALDEVAASPPLDAGDLVLLRGDVLHRTQDAATPRVAVSFRMIASQSSVSRRRLVSGSAKKRDMMLKHSWPYVCALDYYHRVRRGEDAVRELHRYVVDARVSRFAQLRGLAQIALGWHEA